MTKLGARKHLLLTKAIEAKLPRLYSQDGKADAAEVVVKFFSPYTGMRWYAIEGERTEDGDVEFFGWVTGGDEYGYFTLSELENARVFNGRVPAVERDCYWTPVPLGQIKEGVAA